MLDNQDYEDELRSQDKYSADYYKALAKAPSCNHPNHPGCEDCSDE